jgi:arsenate reductase
MAEAILNKLGAGKFQAVSAGAKPVGYVHPLAKQLLQELKYSAEGLRSKSLDEFKGQTFDAVITVCDRAKESCPVWPGAEMIHWSLEDPAEAAGSDSETRNFFRKVFNEIERRIQDFISAEG